MIKVRIATSKARGKAMHIHHMQACIIIQNLHKLNLESIKQLAI